MLIVILGNRGSLGRILSLFLSLKHDVVGIDIDRIDLSNYENYEDQLKEIFDFNLENIVIINCVGIMGAKESEANPYKYYEINGILPYKLKQFFDSKLKSYLFIQISSETVYGKSVNNEQIFSEDDRCLPQHIYGLSKLISEQLLKSTDNTNSATMILRAPILLFKDQKYSNALTYITKEINQKGSATLFGNGGHKRKYAVADDFVQDIENLIGYWAMDPKCFAPYEVLNMPGTVISTKEFVDILLRDYEMKFEMKFEENAKLAFSLLSSSEKFSLITKSTKPDDSVNSLVQWIRKINE
jgi:dTDP-4-dehydrorhamnose reductase